MTKPHRPDVSLGEDSCVTKYGGILYEGSIFDKNSLKYGEAMDSFRGTMGSQDMDRKVELK